MKLIQRGHNHLLRLTHWRAFLRIWRGNQAIGILMMVLWIWAFWILPRDDASFLHFWWIWLFTEMLKGLGHQTSAVSLLFSKEVHPQESSFAKGSWIKGKKQATSYTMRWKFILASYVNCYIPMSVISKPMLFQIYAVWYLTDKKGDKARYRHRRNWNMADKFRHYTL